MTEPAATAHAPATPPSTPRPAPPDAWDRAAAWLDHHGPVPVLGVLTLVVAWMYGGVFGGELAGDDLTFHMAEASRLADCIRHGDWDLWNPSANSGFASAYYYQVIPQLASAIPAAIFGHFVFWFELSTYLPLLLAPAAAYRGARLMGATPWQAVAAAFAVAFISGQSRWGTGADGSFQVGLYTQTWALAAFPLALGHGARWIGGDTGREAGPRSATRRTGLAPAIAWGTFCGLCHPFAGISLGVALFAAVVAQLALSALARVERPAKLALAALLCLGFAANLTLLLARQQLYYLVPTTLFAAAGGRVVWQLVTGQRVDQPPVRQVLAGELVRLLILGACLLVASLPGWITVVVDYDGFGGFPHRVNDEVGPGYRGLMDWQVNGAILDYLRPVVLTWSLPVVVVLGRGTLLRWLWSPAVCYAALLAIGPRMGKTADDLVPAVRFLGAMQIVLALAVGAGMVALGRELWQVRPRTAAWSILRHGMFAAVIGVGIGALLYLAFGSDTNPLITILWRLTLHQIDSPAALRVIGIILVGGGLGVAVRGCWRALDTQYGIRTGLAAIGAALVVLVAVPGGRALGARVRVFGEANHRAELLEIDDVLTTQPGGRKQVGTGAENHWWNLLTYVYGRRPALLQMGGGGLQASPNYDFLWSVRDFKKLAWVFDTPYLVFQRSNAASMPEGEVITQTTNYELRRLLAPGIVSPIEVTGVLPPGRAEARAAAIAWLKTDVPYTDHVLAYAGHGLPGSPDRSPDRRAIVVRAGRQDSPGDHADIFAEVDATRPATFVARESWHPRWHAFVDGREVTVRRVTPDFPAIDVPAGKHLLQFRFERPWWAHVSWLAWPGVVLAAWLVLRALDRRRAPRLTAARVVER